MKKTSIIGLILIAVGIGAWFVFGKGKSGSSQTTPTPTFSPAAEQLTPDKQPKVSLQFSSDAHYVTVNLRNLQADILEYSLEYDAIVKKNKINSGVSGGGKISGKSEFTQKQLLGSESSGKFTYHEGIQNAFMKVTLRDSANRSVFAAIYPFSISAGATLDLVPQEILP
jgi:hypothetical protein